MVVCRIAIASLIYCIQSERKEEDRFIKELVERRNHDSKDEVVVVVEKYTVGIFVVVFGSNVFGSHKVLENIPE